MKTYLFELKDKSLVSVRSMNAKSAYNKIKVHISIDEIASCYHVHISEAGIVRFGLNMITSEINTLIESKEWIMRDINRWHGQATIAMHRVNEYISSNMITQDMIEFFLSKPCGKTDKYAWEIRKVDEVVNLHIWKVQ